MHSVRQIFIMIIIFVSPYHDWRQHPTWTSSATTTKKPNSLLQNEDKFLEICEPVPIPMGHWLPVFRVGRRWLLPVDWQWQESETCSNKLDTSCALPPRCWFRAIYYVQPNSGLSHSYAKSHVCSNYRTFLHGKSTTSTERILVRAVMLNWSIAGIRIWEADGDLWHWKLCNGVSLVGRASVRWLPSYDVCLSLCERPGTQPLSLPEAQHVIIIRTDWIVQIHFADLSRENELRKDQDRGTIGRSAMYLLFCFIYASSMCCVSRCKNKQYYYYHD